MAIPNTTPAPNELFNGEMKKMSDTELRVVLVVTRATLGWEIDPQTGTRKKEDWISRFQLVQKTGRSGRAISTAIETSVQKGWIEARNNQGMILDTPQKRSGKKIYYRLGKVFLDKLTTSEESSLVHQTSEVFSPEKSSLYKRNSITKDISPSSPSAPGTTSPLPKKTPFSRIPQDDPDEEINLETGKPSPGVPKPRIDLAYNALLNWAIERRGGQKFISWGKQRKAMKRMREAGISPSRIKERWLELEENDRRGYGVDFGVVASSFDRKP